MIGLATKTYDIDGARIFETDRAADQSNRQGSRRQSRTATLDGGVSIYDTGYSDGDRTVTLVEPNAPPESIDYARYLCETYSLVIVSMDDGVYEAAGPAYGVSEDGELTVTMLVKSKLSA
jgi:hypothetical protein